MTIVTSVSAASNPPGTEAIISDAVTGDIGASVYAVTFADRGQVVLRYSVSDSRQNRLQPHQSLVTSSGSDCTSGVERNLILHA